MVARPRCAVVDGCGDRVISLRAPCLRTFASLRAAPSFQVLLARRAPLSACRDGPSVRAARVQAVAATDGVRLRRRRRRRGQQHRHRAVSARAAASARAARCVGASHVPSPHRRRTTLVHSSGHTATHLHDRGGGGGVRATRGGRPGGGQSPVAHQPRELAARRGFAALLGRRWSGAGAERPAGARDDDGAAAALSGREGRGGAPPTKRRCDGSSGSGPGRNIPPAAPPSRAAEPSEPHGPLHTTGRRAWPCAIALGRWGVVVMLN